MVISSGSLCFWSGLWCLDRGDMRFLSHTREYTVDLLSNHTGLWVRYHRVQFEDIFQPYLRVVSIQRLQDCFLNWLPIRTRSGRERFVSVVSDSRSTGISRRFAPLSTLYLHVNLLRDSWSKQTAPAGAAAVRR